MRRRLLLFVLLSGMFIPRPVHAQHAFDDLPIDDPAKRSALAPGEDPAKTIRANMFITATVDHPECYPGQQVLLSYKLYTALQSTSTVTAKPILNGFTIKERRPNETPLPDKTIDGRRYHGFLVWQALVTPLQPGEYTIDPLITGNEVSYTNSEGKPGHYSGNLASHKTTIHVLSLPAIEKPPAFTGLVGKWQIQSRLTAPRTDSSGNDTLVIEISGSGNFDNITAPFMRWPAGFRHLEPIQRWAVNDTTTPQSGQTTLVIPFTASTPGQYSLPPLELVGFDPIKQEYYKKQTDSLIVHVLEVAPPPSTPAPPVKPTPEPDTTLSKWVILLGILLGLTIVFLILRRRRTPVTNVAATATAPAENTPAPPPPALTMPDLPKEDLALADIKQTLLHYLQTRLQTDAWAEEDLLDLLQKKDPSLAEKVSPLLEECNQLLYAPHRPDPAILTKLNRQLEAIVRQ